MASSAVAVSNGVPTPTPSMQLDSNNANAIPRSSVNSNADADLAQSINFSAKRKREAGDAGDKLPNGVNLNGNDTPAPAAAAAAASSNTTKIDKSTVRDYYELLQRFDITPSILKRPLSEPDNPDEHETKRQKSDNGASLPSIAGKVARDGYEDAESILIDLKTSITNQLAELRRVEEGKDTKGNDAAIAQVVEFKRKAHALFRREMTYPNLTHVPDALRALDSTNDLQSNASGNMVLSVYGETKKQLYSSLQKPVAAADGADGAFRPLREIGLPNGVKTAKTVPYFFPSAVEKDKKSKTLGELMPAPRNLPSLPPPKAPKSTTKGVQVGWHRPELTEKSKYRAGSYFSQNISTGRWLDYSNAAPPSQIMTKQRERALSLAGNKPSSSDLEMSEMESLFRGAFSSFAPSKDDSAAMISSGLISHTLWWQKAGQRSFDRLVEADLSEGVAPELDKGDTELIEEIDETLIQKMIDDWDESMVDPSLEEACCPKKSDQEKDVDDTLQDVSDMIQTIISYQRNRNLTLPSPSSQSRYAGDPAHSDMLTNGTPVQPDDEETETYKTLKAQLCLVVQMLPPYAVARLNSDKLDELNISTKLEIRTDEYQGLMEEDETAARARAAQVAASNPRPASHRSTSSSNNMQYGGQSYHTTPGRAPMPAAQPYYAHTPVRPQQTAVQRPPQTMPAAYPPRPPSNTGYRPPHPYPKTGYSQPYAKQPAHSPHAGPYAGTPTQSRPLYQPQVQGYPNMGNATPQPRYHPSYAQAPNTQPAAPYHQPYQPQSQQHSTPSHPPYGPYTNGAGNTMPQRTVSPQVHHPPPQQQQHPHVPHQGYHPTPTPTRQGSYGGQPNMSNDPSRRYYPPAGSPAMQNNHVHHQPQHQPQPQPQQPVHQQPVHQQPVHQQHQHMPQHQPQNPPPHQMHHQPQQPSQPQPQTHNQHQSPSTSGPSSFHTSLNPLQVQQAMNQAKARFDAQKSAQQSNEGLRRNSMSGQGQVNPSGQTHVGAPVGLGGIGLGAGQAGMAAARPSMPGSGANYSASSPSPNPQLNSPRMANGSMAINGSPALAPAAPAANAGSSAAGTEA
ncbi:Uu.00g146410.m01.CDS01 [Anthostomella pinea]|uniref:Uu.00g146410.m01.CDS01 n=1 Tax=Anthostomella pinea TaxID=933095 RepID=A0AAI8VR98_9PEZI|nr:Uu.00g146410.m01.CDS01 [Anthostomella pinea]